MATGGRPESEYACQGSREMKPGSILFAALAAWSASTFGAAAEDKVKVGLIVTLSGPPAVLGGQVRDGFNLAVKTLGSAGSTRK
jgi:ABC-type branched-subunit amino acid transport system substrate-binding protein